MSNQMLFLYHFVLLEINYNLKESIKPTLYYYDYVPYICGLWI